MCVSCVSCVRVLHKRLTSEQTSALAWCVCVAETRIMVHLYRFFRLVLHHLPIQLHKPAPFQGLPPHMLVLAMVMRSLRVTHLVAAMASNRDERAISTNPTSSGVGRPARCLVFILSQKKLLGVTGAPATSETLAKCATAMHDSDLLIETARSEMEKGFDQSGATTPSF